MSSYTSLEINVKSKHFLDTQDTDLIIEKTSSNCGINSYRNLDTNNIGLNITFNHGLDKMVDLIKLLESFINYKEISRVGSFSSEDIGSGLHYARVFAYKDKLFIVNKNTNNGFVQQDIYFISDLRENREYYDIFIDENAPDGDKIESTFVKEFIEKAYGLSIES